MEAGRELDVKMAEMLGWTDIYKAYYTSRWRGHAPGESQKYWRNVREYSISWDAMQEVVEAMRERGYGISMRSNGNGWYSSMWQQETAEPVLVSSATADILPHAVCLAALKAVENE